MCTGRPSDALGGTGRNSAIQSFARGNMLGRRKLGPGNPSALLHLSAKRRSKINLLKGLHFCLWIEEGLLQGSCWPLSRQQNKWSGGDAGARDSVGSDWTAWRLNPHQPAEQEQEQALTYRCIFILHFLRQNRISVVNKL